MGKEFLFGKMRTFWIWIMVTVAQCKCTFFQIKIFIEFSQMLPKNSSYNVNVLYVTDCTLKNCLNSKFYVYLTTIKARGCDFSTSVS